MLFGDFHHHVDVDRLDGHFIGHSVGGLIDHAASVGLQVISVTCHEEFIYDDHAVRYARERGVLLLPGMEATADDSHMLLLNFREYPPGVCTMADIEERKTPDSLVIVAHPYYPVGISAMHLLESHRRLFDAVEFSGMYTPLTRRFNARAAEFARRSRLPVVGNTDTHFLWQMGLTFTQIDAPPDAAAVLDAIRLGRVRLHTRPLTWRQVMRFLVASGSVTPIFGDAVRYMAKVLRRTRKAERELGRSKPVVRQFD